MVFAPDYSSFSAFVKIVRHRIDFTTLVLTCDKFAYMLFSVDFAPSDSRHTRWVAGCILPLGADNGTRTRNTTLEESDVTVTLYLHIKCSWLPDFNLRLIA